MLTLLVIAAILAGFAAGYLVRGSLAVALERQRQRAAHTTTWANSTISYSPISRQTSDQSER